MGIRRLQAENGALLHRELFWSLRGIHTLLDAIHGAWADRFGVTTPQLVMVFALRDFDNHGTGLRVKEVATILSVDPTFVTTQSKILEANGFMRRNASSEDGRVVRLSLTEKSLKQLAALSIREQKINDYIFSEFTDQSLQTFVTRASGLKNKMEKASAIALIGLDD